MGVGWSFAGVVEGFMDWWIGGFMGWGLLDSEFAAHRSRFAVHG
jgi:hypothetical protein